MDDIQNLKQLLVNSDQNEFEAIELVKKPSNVDLLAKLDDLDINTLLAVVENTEGFPQLNIEGFNKITEKEAENQNQHSRSSKVKKREQPKVDEIELYKEILRTKVFEKYFDIRGHTDFVASKTFEVNDEKDENNTIHISRLLIYQRKYNLSRIISFFEEKDVKKNRAEEKIIRELPNMNFEYFEFTNNHNFMIAGNRGLIVLWDIEGNYITGYHKIAIKTPEECEAIKNQVDIKNYKSIATKDGLDIYYNVGKFLFNVTIKLEYDTELNVESNYLVLEEDPRFVYINIEEMIIAVVTAGKDSDEAAKEYIQTIKIINPEDMSIAGSTTTNKIYFEDIYFKFSGNSSHMQLKVIRKQVQKLENNEEIRLYLTNVSIVKILSEQSTDEEENRKFNVSFDAESAIMPDFFLNNTVISIENSIFNCLMIYYKTNTILGQKKSTKVKALMDYNLKTEIKKFEKNPCKGLTLIHDKLILKAVYNSLTIYSLNKLKLDPSLKFNRFITKIEVAGNFLFVKTSEVKVNCYRLPLNAKGAISLELTETDIEDIDDKFPEYKMKKIIAALCGAKDSTNLKVFLEWKLKNLTPENFEHLPIKKTIQGKTLACTEILLQHILKLDVNFPKMRYIYDEIESNLHDIISSGCPSVPALLNNLFTYDLEYGTPKSEYLPLYQSYDFRGSSLRGYFFGNPSKNDKEYSIKNSLIKTPDTLGTWNSLKLTKCLCEVEDLKIFGTEFIRTYIRSKWASLRAAVLGLTFVMWLNIVLVVFLVTKSEEHIYFYLFVFVNVLLVSSEVIQACNLQLQSYLGIYEINYVSVFQLLISVFITFVYQDLYVFNLFVFVQAASVQKIVKFFLIPNEITAIVLLCIPAFLFLIFFSYSSNHFYYYIFIGVLESLIYIGSFNKDDNLLGTRLGLQCIGITFFAFYENANLYLLLFNMLFLAPEVNYLAKLVKKKECTKEHAIDFINCLVGRLLIIISFWLQDNTYAIVGLAVVVLYSLYRTTSVYMILSEERLKIMNFLCYRFGLYLLFASIITGNSIFLYCFLIFNVIEFIWLRSTSFKGLVDDIFQLFFNWNTIDIIRYLISIIWIFKFKMIQIDQGDNYKGELPSIVLTWVFVLLNLIKALLGFRAFDQTRFYVRLIFKCVVEIIPFLIIFVFFTFSFGLLNVVDKNDSSFATFWSEPLDQSLGGFSHSENESILQYVMFSMGTLLIVIIMLNLLISILGDTFSRCLDEAKLIDYKVMIETVYEVEALLFWRKSACSVKFFASCDHLEATDKDIETAWQARLEAVEEKLDNNKEELNRNIQGVKDQLDMIMNMLGKRDNVPGESSN